MLIRVNKHETVMGGTAETLQPRFCIICFPNLSQSLVDYCKIHKMKTAPEF